MASNHPQFIRAPIYPQLIKRGHKWLQKCGIALYACILIFQISAAEEAAPILLHEHKWLIVECYIFSHENNPQAETFPLLDTLSYPTPLVNLRHLSDDLYHKLFLNPYESGDVSTTNVNFSNMAFNTLPPQLQRTLLPTNSIDMQEKVRALPHTYRMLFHQAWLQPVLTTKKAPYILIEGGKTVNNHYELGGVLHISQRRYIHLNTDLWLINFSAPIADQEKTNQSVVRGDYTPLLSIPNPRTLTVEEWLSELNAPLPATSSPPFLISTMSVSVSNFIFAKPMQEGPMSEFIPSQAIRYSRMPISRVVVMQQHQRLGESRWHYFDHPYFGMLIKVTPWKIPNFIQPILVPEEEEGTFPFIEY